MPENLKNFRLEDSLFNTLIKIVYMRDTITPKLIVSLHTLLVVAATSVPRNCWVLWRQSLQREGFYNPKVSRQHVTCASVWK